MKREARPGVTEGNCSHFGRLSADAVPIQTPAACVL
jgi:hypothetical protein